MRTLCAAYRLRALVKYAYYMKKVLLFSVQFLCSKLLHYDMYASCPNKKILVKRNELR